MNFKPLEAAEQNRLKAALRRNAEDSKPILLDRRDTTFRESVDEITDDEAISAIRSVPCHYAWPEDASSERSRLDETVKPRDSKFVCFGAQSIDQASCVEVGGRAVVSAEIHIERIRASVELVKMCGIDGKVAAGSVVDAAIDFLIREFEANKP